MAAMVVVCNAPRGFSSLVREPRAFLHAFAPAIINLELLRDYSECYAPMRTEDEIRGSALLYWLCRLPLGRPFAAIFIASKPGRKPGENSVSLAFPPFCSLRASRRWETPRKISPPDHPHPRLTPGPSTLATTAPRIIPLASAARCGPARDVSIGEI